MTKLESATRGLAVPQAGALLGHKYRVIANIGEGGMGTVFRAENIVTGKQVALKWMHPHVAADSDAAARLLREAQAASRLTHPNVVDVYDIVQDDHTLFLVMELLQGETLGSWLQRNRRPKISEFIALLLPAMEGVAAAHAKGVIHRDLKPDNIFLVGVPGSARATAKVVDFGIAKVAGTKGLTLTGTGMSLGTPLYMSLEQLRGDKDVDVRTDVYAFGVMLYEAITGQTPYSAATLSELAIKVATTDPAPVKQLRPDVPTPLARIVDWAIARKREQRLPNVRTLIQELDAFAQDYSFRNQMTNHAAPMPRLAADESNHLESSDALPPRAAAGRVPVPPGPGARDAQIAPLGAAAVASASADTLTARELAPARNTRRRWLSVRLVVALCVVGAIVVAAVWMRTGSHPFSSKTPPIATGGSLPASTPPEVRAAPNEPSQLPRPALPQQDGPARSAAVAPTTVFTPPVPAAIDLTGAHEAPVVVGAPPPSATPTPHELAPPATVTAPPARAPLAPAKPQAARAARNKSPVAGKSAADELAF